jgi:hypothetical protein
MVPLIALIIGALIWLNGSGPDYPGPRHVQHIASLLEGSQAEGAPTGTFMEREAITAIRSLERPIVERSEADRGDGRVRFVVSGGESGAVWIIFDENTSEILEVKREAE